MMISAIKEIKKEISPTPKLPIVTNSLNVPSVAIHSKKYKLCNPKSRNIEAPDSGARLTFVLMSKINFQSANVIKTMVIALITRVDKISEDSKYVVTCKNKVSPTLAKSKNKTFHLKQGIQGHNY